MKKQFSVIVVLALAMASNFAHAAGGGGAGFDLSSLLAGISFSNVAVGILAVGALLAGLYAAIAGVKHVLKFVRGA